MRSIRRILVAVKDPRTPSSALLAKAAQLARAFEAQLELFHAISSALYVDAFALGASLPDLQADTYSERSAQLQRLAAPLQSQGLKVSVSVQWDYPVYEAIVRRAQRVKADLIVAERHAGRHFAPALLHLTDWELLRLSPIPVLLVKTRELYRQPVVLAAIDPQHTFAKPLKLDAEILRLTGLFASALQGSEHAVHAYIPLATMPNRPVTADTVNRLAAQAHEQASRRFDQALAKSDIPHKCRHLIPRHPIDAIAEVARETHSDIVVMGAISRSGLRRLVIGNTAESVLDTLGCDLLIVKPREFQSRIQSTPRGLRYAVSPLLQVPY